MQLAIYRAKPRISTLDSDRVTNSSISQGEDLNSGLLDYKSSALSNL